MVHVFQMCSSAQSWKKLPFELYDPRDRPLREGTIGSDPSENMPGSEQDLLKGPCAESGFEEQTSVSSKSTEDSSQPINWLDLGDNTATLTVMQGHTWAVWAA